MTLIPQRTVASQIASHLRTNIEKGLWLDWLPTERVLCQTLQASRNTVRSAINQLKADGLVVAQRPTGNRITISSRRARNRKQTKSVGIIVPESLNTLRPLVTLWIDELKDMLTKEGCLTSVHDGQQYYGANAERALARLTTQNHQDAWVLVLSSKRMQEWFSSRRVRCLVAGSIFRGVELPCCDLDYRAICRHATGVLLRLGHRRIALLNRDDPRAGEVAGEQGFLEAMRASTHRDTTAEIAYHRDDVESVGRALKKLRKHQQGFPTALIVNSASVYLSVITLLASYGLRVPQDVSLICRDGDPLLNAVFPAAARYTVSPHAFARRLIRPLSELIRGLTVAHSTTHFLPKFTSGGSIAPVARGDSL